MSTDQIHDTATGDRQRAIAEVQPIALPFYCADCGHRWQSATGGDCPVCAPRYQKHGKQIAGIVLPKKAK